VAGLAWLIEGAVPGDIVQATTLKRRPRYVEAVAVSIDRPSPLRRRPPCPIQGVCGGCPLMVVDETAQRAAKKRFLVDALHRIGGLPGAPVDDVVAAGSALGYRNKIELTFGRIGSQPVLGYHRAGLPAELVDVEHCTIADTRLAPLLTAARDFFLGGGGNAAAGVRGEPARLILRASHARDQRLIAIRGAAGSADGLRDFARIAAAADPGLVGVVRILAATGRRGGARIETIAGRPEIDEEILGTMFHVPAATFLQVHPDASRRLAEHLIEAAKRPARVLELYGGIGAVSLALARRGAAATVVDADAAAIACGVQATREAGLQSVEFARADVSAFLGSSRGAPRPDLVVADPPRTGLGKGVALQIAALRPPRIALVSCDPATLARDLAVLSASGYAVERVTPFDLFPQTAHVEALAWLRLSG
jgi:23S rRNA (uracil1939-C5)-methyltransferase